MADHDPCPSAVLLVQADLEIERLRAELAGWQDRLGQYTHNAEAEIERLRAALQAVVDDTEGDLDYVKWQARAVLDRSKDT